MDKFDAILACVMVPVVAFYLVVIWQAVNAIA